MIKVTYTIILSNPNNTFVTRYSNASFRLDNFCRVIGLDDDDHGGGHNVYKFMNLYVDGISVRLHSVSNPLTQYKKQVRAYI